MVFGHKLVLGVVVEGVGSGVGGAVVGGSCCDQPVTCSQHW